MSTSVGITVPKLLPITATFSPLFAGYFSLLSWRVIRQRQITDQNFGLPSTPANPAVPADGLTVATRCHNNFTENVPLALLLGAVVELNGGNRRVLTGGLSALFLMRILHVEWGLRATDQKGYGRVVGYLGTLGWVVGAAGYAAYLIKGYWGF